MVILSGWLNTSKTKPSGLPGVAPRCTQSIQPMKQLSIGLDAVDTFEYPDLYRGHRLIAQKYPTQHCDRLGYYKAETWSCKVHGDSEFDGKILAIEHRLAEEAIASAMMYLDIFIGKVKSKHHYSEYYNQALDRVNARLALDQKLLCSETHSAVSRPYD